MKKYIYRVMRHLRNRKMTIQALPFNLNEIKAVVFHGDSNSHSHDAMWAPVMERVGIPYVSIFAAVRRDPFKRTSRYSLNADTIEQFDKLIQSMPNLKVAIYASNNSRNAWMVRFNHIRHVFVGHGDSDKPSSANRMFRLYDEVWTAGDAHIDRFRKLDADYSAVHFVKVGQPWLKDKLSAIEEIEKSGTPTICYLPTWRGYFSDGQLSSMSKSAEILAILKEELGAGALPVRMKPHPWTKKRELKDIEKGGRPYGNFTILPPTSSIWSPEIGNVRFFIADTSAIITECLFFDRPIIQYVAPQSELFAKSYDFASDFTYKFTTLAQFREIIRTIVATGNDIQMAARQKHLAYRVDIEKLKQDSFADEVRRLIGGATPT
jgi:hypothetical protein